MAKRNGRTGTPNTKGVAKKSSASRILNPWGKPIPMRIRSAWSAVSGSDAKKAHPSPELAPQTKGYPRNKPGKWPVEPDYVNHTPAPDPYGLTNGIRADLNATVEHAYTRAGYQQAP